MKFRLVLFFLSITLVGSVFGQLAHQMRIKPEDIATAEELKKEYPKENFVSLSTVATYTFNYSIKTKKIEANLHYAETIMALKESKTFKNVVWFDKKSDIVKIEGRNYKNKLAYISSSKSDYASAGIFYGDAKMFNYNFNLSTRGDKTKYYYKKKYDDIKYLTSVFFHTHYPVKEKKIIFKIPTWLTLDFIEENFNGYNIIKTEKIDEKKKVNVVTYILKDIKPVKKANFSASWANALPNLLVLAKKYDYKGKTYTLFSETKDLYNWYASLVKEVGNKPEALKSLVNEITAGAKTDEEKIKKIFYWVQDNIRYIAFENGIMGFKPENANNVCKNKYGDCKGMANLTTQMLKMAGFDARLTWIGTRSIPYDYSTPSLADDNHMISTLFFNHKRYFLDATETGVAFKDYAYRIQGQDVLIENKDTFIIDTIPEFDAKHNEEKITLNLTIDGDKLVGQGKNVYKGEEKTSLFRDIGNVAKVDLNDKIEKFIANHDKNNTITNLNIINADNRDLPISFKYDIEITNHITSVENESYISLELDFDFYDILAKKDRIIDMDFQEKIYKNKTTILKIPTNYKISFLPEAININNDEFSFNLSYKLNEATNTITYAKIMEIKKGIISKANFEIWNETIKKLKKFYYEQIVIVKK